MYQKEKAKYPFSEWERKRELSRGSVGFLN